MREVGTERADVAGEVLREAMEFLAKEGTKHATGALTPEEADVLEALRLAMRAGGVVSHVTGSDAIEEVAGLLAAVPWETLTRWLATLRRWQRTIGDGSIVVEDGVAVGPE